MLKGIMNFIRDEEGASAVEYGLLAALIAAVIVAAVGSVGTTLNATFEKVAEDVAIPGGGGS